MITCKFITQFKKSNIYEYLRVSWASLSNHSHLLPILLRFVFIIHSLAFKKKKGSITYISSYACF